MCVFIVLLVYFCSYLCFGIIQKKYCQNQCERETKNRFTDIENKLGLAKGELEMGGEQGLPGNLILAVAHCFILKE